MIASSFRPSLQRDFLLSLAIEGAYRPAWSSVILDELEYEETAKLIERGADEDDAALRAHRLSKQMRSLPTMPRSADGRVWTARTVFRTPTTNTWPQLW